MTALASWCAGDTWIEALPVDEAVPMLFEMGPDRFAIAGRVRHDAPFGEGRCAQAIGVSTREPLGRVPLRGARLRLHLSAMDHRDGGGRRAGSAAMRRACRIGMLAAVGSTLALTPRGPASTRGAEACGPFALDFAFVRVASPEDPQAYVAGALGVVRPSFRLPWLVTAYRHLAGQPLGAAAQRALAGPWEPGVRVPPGTLSGTQRWLKARSDALKEPEVYTHIPLAALDPTTGAYFDNCSERAFEAAAKTLQERVAALGSDAPAIKAWVAAQDQVWRTAGAIAAPCHRSPPSSTPRRRRRRAPIAPTRSRPRCSTPASGMPR